MLIILKKKVGTNQWGYPLAPKLFTQQFINPENSGELIAFNDSAKTLEELNVLSDYLIVEYINPITEPDPVVNIDIIGDKVGNQMPLGDTIAFTATFSDTSINGTIPVSIVDRDGVHKANVYVVITNGVGIGTFTPTVAIDYFVTEKGINFHTGALNATLTLTETFYIRVVGI